MPVFILMSWTGGTVMFAHCSL